MLSISPFDKKTLSLFKRPIILKFIRFTLCIVWFVWAIIPCVQAQPQGTPPGSDSLAITDIWIRDPYLLADSATQTYYLFGTTSSSQKPGSAGFDLYTSQNLQTWQGPYPIFRPFPGFWGSKNYWAPECHPYRGKYYLFATFYDSTTQLRGTTVLVADRPEGPYREHAIGPLTPPTWGALDGTLYIDPQGNPWMVFCHEWTQIGDGTIAAMPLSTDLKTPAGDPQTLFSASSAPWVKPHAPQKYVTDGPFLFRNSKGELLMLWSSFGTDGYALGIARSRSGAIQGPWEHLPHPLFTSDGGHGMLVRTFNGQLVLTLHQPNQWPNERAQLFMIEENSEGIPTVKCHFTASDKTNSDKTIK